jgi:hypothetical protein
LRARGFPDSAAAGGENTALMPVRTLLPFALLAAALGIVTPATAKPKKAARAAPELSISGSLTRTSTLVVSCKRPAFGIDVVETTTTITIRRYSFEGTSGTRGSAGVIRSTGEEEMSSETKVEGKTDLIKPSKMGPIKRAIPGTTSSWSAVVTNGRGKVGVDLAGVTGSERSAKLALPKRGRTVEHFLEPSTRTREDRAGGPCTSTDETHTSGSVKLTRRR